MPPAVRQLAIVLYAHFGISMRGISRLFKVSTQAVLTWVRASSDRVDEPKEGAAELIQVDEWRKNQLILSIRGMLKINC